MPVKHAPGETTTRGSFVPSAATTSERRASRSLGSADDAMTASHSEPCQDDDAGEDETGAGSPADEHAASVTRSMQKAAAATDLWITGCVLAQIETIQDQSARSGSA
jgi:hypothetical protein